MMSRYNKVAKKTGGDSVFFKSNDSNIKINRQNNKENADTNYL